MANSKDNLQKYGKGFIGFDEPSGNAMDSIGGWTGTLFNSPARVTGWNNKGYAMSFNGTNQAIQFNSNVIPVGTKSIRFKLKKASYSNVIEFLMGNTNGTLESGTSIFINNGTLYVQITKGTTGDPNLLMGYNISQLANQFLDVLFTFNNETLDAKLYVNNMINPVLTSIAKVADVNVPSRNFKIGANFNTTPTQFFNGQLDSIEIYDRVISPIPDKYLVQHNSQYKYHNGTAWQTTTATETNFKQYGMSQLSQITEEQWKELTGVKSLAMWSDFEDKKWSNAVLNVESYTPQDLLGDTAQAIYYTDSDTTKIAVETGVEPYSVYDYIGELPTVAIYTESNEDIVVSTNVEPFDIYDEFGESVEVLYYTDDEAVTNADLILEANWSPIDDIEGDFEIVTWTDEGSDTAQRVLDMKAVPVPQFIYSTEITSFQNGVLKILATDLSMYDKSTPARLLFTSDNVTWYTWNGESFVSVVLTHDNILTQGLTIQQATNLTNTQLVTWSSDKMNIGVYLYDSVRDKFQSIVSDIGSETELYSQTSKIEDINLYILNTTATIQIQLDGLTLTGQVDDEDMTRVQYRVLLNDAPYYPETGDFTPLSAPPLNIDLTLRSDEIKINDWNTIKVEFKDYFGTVDYWEADFIGRYAGLMFTNKTGEYYSTDLGQVLQYLDFGQILTGQISVTHEVIVENTYGYDLTDVNIAVNTNQFAEGLHVQLGSTEEDVQEVSRISLGDMADTAKQSFFIRLASDVNAVPNNSTTFNIVATANRNIVREN